MNKHEREVRRLISELAARAGVIVDFDIRCKGTHKICSIRKGKAHRQLCYTISRSDEAGQLGHVKRNFRKLVEELGA